MPVPDAIQNAPVLAPGLELYWEAFMELSSCRSIGMGIGPIPWTAIRAYAAYLGLGDGEDFHRFQTLVRGMDAVYLDHHVKKQKED